MMRTSRFSPFLLIPFVILFVASCGTRRLDVTRPETQLNVGVRAAKDNLWREAQFRFERAVQMNPSDAWAHNNLAVAYEGIGEFEKARLAYIEALRLDRSNPHIQKNYSRFVEFSTKNRKREPASANESETTATLVARPGGAAVESAAQAPAAPIAAPSDSADGDAEPEAAAPASPPAAPPEPDSDEPTDDLDSPDDEGGE